MNHDLACQYIHATVEGWIVRNYVKRVKEQRRQQEAERSRTRYKTDISYKRQQKERAKKRQEELVIEDRCSLVKQLKHDGWYEREIIAELYKRSGNKKTYSRHDIRKMLKTVEQRPIPNPFPNNLLIKQRHNKETEQQGRPITMDELEDILNGISSNSYDSDSDMDDSNTTSETEMSPTLRRAAPRRREPKYQIRSPHLYDQTECD